ncbi:MAG: neocarzinostatin apoprotein domain-containing protein [Acidimicrobiia bacterium]
MPSAFAASAIAAPAVSGAAGSAPVASTTMTMVDTSRSTAAWGGKPEAPSRTLVTTIWYPNPSSRSRRPGKGAYPLVVFSHGLGANPELYRPLLAAWAAAGYVVAAPQFPLSSSATPGGADAGDVENQPGDVSFVIDRVLSASAAPSGPLSGLVDAKKIGVAGHSNGAITTLGVVANTCCRDPRVKAAIEMAGATEGMGRGRYDFAKAPPLFVVHDVHDGLVPYAGAIAIYNRARGPKALLSIDWDSPSDATGVVAHGAAAAMVGPTTGAVVTSTTDFFDAILKHERRAARAVSADGRSSHSKVYTAWTRGSRAKLPVPKPAEVHLQATVTPDRGLHDGDAVTVQWSGYSAGKVVNILECSHVDLTSGGSSGCSFDHAALLHPDPTGSGSVVIHVGTGAIGNGICDAAHSCSIIVNNASLTDPADTKVLPISFAP